jgi:hypothetical protein
MTALMCQSLMSLGSYRRRLSGTRELLSLVLKNGYKVTPEAEKLLEHFCPDSSESDEEIVHVVVSPRQLGFERTIEKPTLAHLIDLNMLCGWSEENLNGETLELCEPDDVCHVCENYSDQPEWEVLRMGMSPLSLADQNGSVIFEVDHGFSGKCLRTRPAELATSYNLDSKWIYRLMKKGRSGRYTPKAEPIRYSM